MAETEDYEGFVKRLATALGAPKKTAEIAAAVGTLRAKADERDELAERVRTDVQAISALLPTQLDLEDVRSGLERADRPLAARLDKIRGILAALRRHVEGVE